LNIDSLVFSSRLELIKAVVFVLVIWMILSSIGKYLIKSKRFSCGKCDGRLDHNKKRLCPHCGVELS